MTGPPPLLAFSDDCAGLPVSFAVFDFGRQLLVWAAPSEGGGENLLGALALGAPGTAAAASSSSSSSSSSPSPRRGASATTLLRGGSGSAAAGREDEGSVALARRLAARLGRPVAVAWNLPSLSGGSGSSAASAASATSADAAALNGWAERRLLAELDRAGMLPARVAAAKASAEGE